ncbi:MAG: hypothetical protein JAZ02_03075 [Candidatus Thiodiazotropha endolucinida]|nr:hypothetical protein [Candidatus Thiodiazotropha sp. (ex Lucina pensylvanica)]MCG8022956.1 hypothetical protein [Candidatus Thiodiazotropha endolucinida]
MWARSSESRLFLLTGDGPQTRRRGGSDGGGGHQLSVHFVIKRQFDLALVDSSVEENGIARSRVAALLYRSFARC